MDLSFHDGKEGIASRDHLLQDSEMDGAETGRGGKQHSNKKQVQRRMVKPRG